MAGSSTARGVRPEPDDSPGSAPRRGLTPQARFYFDFASPDAYLAAEQVNAVLPEIPEWVPVAIGPPAFRCQAEIDAYREDVERRAHALQLQTMRWPEEFPAESEFALLAATYAKSIGRAVAFSLAAFRQAFAGGRDLSERDNVLIAAAACEMHPSAVMKGAGLRGTREKLERATAEARAAGVVAVPAVVGPDGTVDDLSALLR
jgi:2-hydroxychromene-2-carboxylate isomerase